MWLLKATMNPHKGLELFDDEDVQVHVLSAETYRHYVNLESQFAKAIALQRATQESLALALFSDGEAGEDEDDGDDEDENSNIADPAHIAEVN